jgi:hypothetical protein
MQNIISTGEPVVQKLTHEWYGKALAVPVEYSFTIEEDNLVFRASQAAPVTIHPDAEPGEFTEELWMYDTAEFFVADADGKQYMEFNLCPNGAWWACAFSAPRVRDAAAGVPVAVRTTGEVTPEGWRCSATLPLAYLRSMDIDIFSCRLAATCILNSPDYLFYTTSDDQSGEPDFHRPQSWAKARFV